MIKDQLFDLSDTPQKVKLINHIRATRGRHRVTVIRYHPRRSDRQNRYYWPCFVVPFAEFLRDQGETCGDQAAHEVLKARFLRREVVVEGTGEVVTYVRSTTDLNTVEFNEYLDRCAHWLADTLGIVVPEPAVYREKQLPPGEKEPE